jgi:LytS/YehU family sensor histidine kinase
VDELLLARIESRRIHVVAREDTRLGDLPTANLLQRSDFVHGIEVGFALGGATGILAGLVAVAFPPEGVVLGGWTLLVCALAGALIGAWASGMIGSDLRNSQLKAFEAAVENGQVLIMIDIPAAKVDSVTKMIKLHHPEADMHGVEPTIPVFP